MWHVDVDIWKLFEKKKRFAVDKIKVYTYTQVLIGNYMGHVNFTFENKISDSSQYFRKEYDNIYN